jgi:hypothetical protein
LAFRRERLKERYGKDAVGDALVKLDKEQILHEVKVIASLDLPEDIKEEVEQEITRAVCEHRITLSSLDANSVQSFLQLVHERDSAPVRPISPNSKSTKARGAKSRRKGRRAHRRQARSKPNTKSHTEEYSVAAVQAKKEKLRKQGLRNQTLRAERLAAGLCRYCGKSPSILGRNVCQECTDKKQRSLRILKESRISRGLCAHCGARPARLTSLICELCTPTGTVSNNTRRPQYKRKARVGDKKYLYFVEPVRPSTSAWRTPGSGYYVVEIRLPPYSLRKTFTINMYGGKENAYHAALEWRDAQLDALGIPKDSNAPFFPRQFQTVSQRNKRTGLVGVSYHLPGKNYGAYFSAKWRENGTPRTRSFAISKYGYEEAFQRAIAYRRERMAELYGHMPHFNYYGTTNLPKQIQWGEHTTISINRSDMVGFGFLPGDEAKVRRGDKPSDRELIVIKAGRKFKYALRYLRVDSSRRWRLIAAPETGYREHICRPDEVKVIGVVVELFRAGQSVELPLLVRMAQALSGN